MKTERVLLNEIVDRQATIAVVGLGYVGLPLAVELGKTFDVIGFDVKQARIAELALHFDRTLEVEAEELKEATKLKFSNTVEDLAAADVFIVTVPTPIDDARQPDLTPLLKASETVGKMMKRGALVIYESTVYPGCTEEKCVPVLEAQSGFVFNQDFWCGYSPERINPGDKNHRLPDILKVTSGSTPEIAECVDRLYASIVRAGTHCAPCIRVAEAAKIIENCQRDINIAFVNELSQIFNRMGLDTLDVLEAAGTKWNFLPFRPGLVGGHCIGVDPYYLTYKAQQLGHHPQIILAGRRTNDGMGNYIASQIVKLMIRKGHRISGKRVLILGVTFKENCPDIRNSRVIDVITELQGFDCQVECFDPWASKAEVEHEYGLSLLEDLPEEPVYSAVVLAVAHSSFKELNPRALCAENGVVYDLKSIFPKGESDGRL